MNEMIATKLLLSAVLVMFMVLFGRHMLCWVRTESWKLNSDFWSSIVAGTVVILIAWFV